MIKNYIESEEATTERITYSEQVSILNIKTAVSRLNTLTLVAGINDAFNRAVLMLVTTYGLLSSYSKVSPDSNLTEATQNLISTYVLVLLILFFGVFWNISKGTMERAIEKISEIILRNLSVDPASDGAGAWEKAVIELQSSNTSTSTGRRKAYLLSREPMILTFTASLLLLVSDLWLLF